MKSEKDKIFTGERFIPESNDTELELEHVQRYHSIRNLIKDKIVIDAACGEGYGSNILAKYAKTVVGIDIDKITINNACEKYKTQENLKFIEGRIDNFHMIESSSIDIVVSFETIEHVNRELQLKFASEMKRVLKEDGIVIISTPDKEQYSDRYNFKNEYHVAEFYKNEFVDFLKVRFKNIILYNQYLEVASFIDKDDKDEEIIQFYKDKSRYSPVGKYLIAVASNVKIPDISLSMVSMHFREEYNPTLEELNYCRNEAITCRKKVEQMDIVLNENKLLKEEMDRRLVELDHRMDEINLRDRLIMDKEATIRRLQDEKEDTIKRLQDDIDMISEQCANEIESIKKLSLIKWLRFRKSKTEDLK